MFAFLENTLNLGIFTHALLSLLKTHPTFLSSTLRRGKLFIPRGSIFLKILFPPIAERAGGNDDLFYKNSIKEYEDDLEYWNINLFIFAWFVIYWKYDGFTVL